MADHLIYHYEDEPHRVDFPGKLEVALYQHPDVLESSIEETVDSQDFTIRYRIGEEDHSIRYVIDETIELAEARSGQTAEDGLLHLVDRSIGDNAQAGIEIVQQLVTRRVPKAQIWMVTAYETHARQDLRLTGIDVYPKPSPSTTMIETILALILEKRV